MRNDDMEPTPEGWCPTQWGAYQRSMQKSRDHRDFLMKTIMISCAALATGDEEHIEKTNSVVYARHEFWDEDHR